jgi:hypothetical protein
MTTTTTDTPTRLVETGLKDILDIVADCVWMVDAIIVNPCGHVQRTKAVVIDPDQLEPHRETVRQLLEELCPVFFIDGGYPIWDRGSFDCDGQQWTDDLWLVSKLFELGIALDYAWQPNPDMNDFYQIDTTIKPTV